MTKTKKTQKQNNMTVSAESIQWHIEGLSDKSLLGKYFF